jgi:multidrug resistance efflux pump
MRTESIVDLASCSELRQTLEARPPGLVHGAVLVTAGLLAALLVWAALAPADLVVRAAARVRPRDAPLTTFLRESGEEVVASVGGRVIEVRVRDGAEVQQGDVLLRLDGERLDNELAATRRRVDTGHEELAALERMERLGEAELEAARARLQAEADEAASGQRRARQRRAAEIRGAELELEAARGDEARTRAMRDGGASSEADLARASARARQSAARLEAARASLEDGRLEVLRRQQVELERRHEVGREELRSRAAARRGELEALERALANLELERAQTVVRAHAAGIVMLGGVRPGELVRPHDRLAVITRRVGFRVDAAVSVVDVAQLRRGMPVRVKVDAYDFQRYGVLTGRIAAVSEEAQAAQGGQAPFYVVSVELDREVLARGAARGELKLGMTAQVEIITGSESLLALFVKKIRQAVSLG